MRSRTVDGLSVSQWLGRGALAAGLVFTAVLKFEDSGGTLIAHSWVDRVGGPWVLIVAGVIEAAIASAILSKSWRFAARIAFWVLCVYGVILVALTALGEPPSQCGCFGTSQAPVLAHFATLIGLLLLARVLACSQSRTQPAAG